MLARRHPSTSGRIRKTPRGGSFTVRQHQEGEQDARRADGDERDAPAFDLAPVRRAD